MKQSPKIANIQTIDDLKKFTIVQGVGWSDTKILRHHGFTVIEAGSYQGLFKMIAAKHADLFCRGISEFKNEYLAHQANDALAYDETFALAYSLPRFLVLGSNNVLLKKRLAEGIGISYQDGSLKKLLLAHYAINIDFANLKGRKIFFLDNPFIKNLNAEFEKYYLPLNSLQ